MTPFFGWLALACLVIGGLLAWRCYPRGELAGFDRRTKLCLIGLAVLSWSPHLAFAGLMTGGGA